MTALFKSKPFIFVVPFDRPLLTQFHQNISFPRQANTQIGYSKTTVIYKLTVIAMGVFSICVNIAENFKCWFTYIIAIHNLFFVVPTHTPNKPLTKINSTWCSIKDIMNKVPWGLDKNDFVNRS